MSMRYAGRTDSSGRPIGTTAIHALNHQRRSREAYISIDTLRGDNPVERGTWRFAKLCEMQGWQRVASRKARDSLFTLLGEKP